MVRHRDTTSITRYVHGFQYYDNVLQFFHTPEGYVKNTPDENGDPSFDYVYQYKDHLGNVRLSYTQNPQSGALEILEEAHYYPFGLQHGNYNTHRSKIDRDEELNNEKSLLDTAPPTFAFENRGYNYKFGGKELQSEFGVEMYDFGARNYDPALGRWMNIDPLAENYQSISPYTYALNNPVFFIDPDGRQVIASTVVNDEGEVIDYQDDGDPNIYLNDRDGPVIGQEEKGRKYKKGEKIFDVDRSAPDYTLYSLITSTGKLIASAAVQSVSKSIPVLDESGKIIGYWRTKLNVPFKTLKMVNGVLRPLGTVFTAASTVSDISQYANNEISGIRLTYRSTGTAGSIVATFAVGGVPGLAVGVVVGGVFYVGEMIYDGVKSDRAYNREAEKSNFNIDINGTVRKNRQDLSIESVEYHFGGG